MYPGTIVDQISLSQTRQARYIPKWFLEVGCQGCDIFYNIPKLENIPNALQIYQITTKYTKWSQNIPKDHTMNQTKIYLMVKKYSKSPQNVRMAVKY
jgi:hypothetical protein